MVRCRRNDIERHFKRGFRYCSSFGITRLILRNDCRGTAIAG
ncbi:hypothetical protein BURPS1106B_A4033 [Burkholderia pseudomallei 1106b]|uniref:Uncharacterized protein n=1 Tax=Burkholderia pseudomallei (strain 1106a) TaxID=357348 RepID=A3NRQ6_BURP0|nr:hypothetical protein BURPS668_0732 [Burkholderia pseudomallei 668]ABN92141.1 hypothetical protein BURPS1106A_0745 [Burkholderia pseudomallei 1106a]EEH27312.1 conserved hypothetical protein [Burkholderia pseudomallei Pakistan 9]EES27292.1 hypothetical protein BURPS1106B_A4033 [Burkholderia pseudomallei 1106b]